MKCHHHGTWRSETLPVNTSQPQRLVLCVAFHAEAPKRPPRMPTLLLLGFFFRAYAAGVGVGGGCSRRLSFVVHVACCFPLQYFSTSVCVGQMRLSPGLTHLSFSLGIKVVRKCTYYLFFFFVDQHVCEARPRWILSRMNALLCPPAQRVCRASTIEHCLCS